MNQALPVSLASMLGVAWHASGTHDRGLEAAVQLRHALELRDPTIAGHLLRVPAYMRIVAGAIVRDAGREAVICDASTLHDIGRLALPDAILHHGGSLSDAERTLMRTHVAHGHAILRHGSSTLMRAAASMALHHHEKWDGTGYPEGLSGRAIPLEARLLAVVDVFDALSSHRPQRCALGLDFALEYVERQRGLHFDPDCVDAFLAERDRVLAVRARYPDLSADQRKLNSDRPVTRR